MFWRERTPRARSQPPSQWLRSPCPPSHCNGAADRKDSPRRTRPRVLRICERFLLGRGRSRQVCASARRFRLWLSAAPAERARAIADTVGRCAGRASALARGGAGLRWLRGKARCSCARARLTRSHCRSPFRASSRSGSKTCCRQAVRMPPYANAGETCGP